MFHEMNKRIYMTTYNICSTSIYVCVWLLIPTMHCADYNRMYIWMSEDSEGVHDASHCRMPCMYGLWSGFDLWMSKMPDQQRQILSSQIAVILPKCIHSALFCLSLILEVLAAPYMGRRFEKTCDVISSISHIHKPKTHIFGFDFNWFSRRMFFWFKSDRKFSGGYLH